MRSQGLLSAAVLVSALGYFVDLYDLVTFTVVRIPSLADLGVTGTEALRTGLIILNVQQAGLIVGGILWGVLADKRGRVRVLFASIALYSLANLANAFVTSVPMYAALRFVAGVGLAGELGIAVTLVSELLPPERRTFGSAIISAIGVCGAILAALTGNLLGWRVVFAIGGVLGLALLVLRVRLAESGLYAALEGTPHARGDLALFARSPKRIGKLAKVVIVGVPNWFVAGILVALAPEIGAGLHASARLDAGVAVMVFYVCYGVGVALASALSTRYQDRWRVTAAFLVATAIFSYCYLFVPGSPPAYYYAMLGLASLATGYVPLSVLMTTELFGTNLRATATAAMPNLVRGSLIVMTLMLAGFGALGLAIVPGAILVGGIACAAALFALRALPETYGRDLTFVED